MAKNLAITRFSGAVARYTMIPHGPDLGNPVSRIGYLSGFTFIHSAYSESDRPAGCIDEAPEFEGASNSPNADRFPAIFGRFRRFFVKMVHNTTSVSGFLFRFEFVAMDYIENVVQIDRVRRRIFKILGSKSHFWPFSPFFAKMAAKVISPSSFHLRFAFLFLHFIRNGKQVDT